MTFEINISESEDRFCSDIWGASYAWSDDEKYGAEYNYCIDNGENCSAIYYMEYNPKTDYMDTDTSRYEHYEVDFENQNWRQLLKETMESILLTWRDEDEQSKKKTAWRSAGTD